jgi:MFS family permease
MQGAIGSSFFLGWCLLSTLIPSLANKFGRKPIAIVTFSVTSAALFVTLYNESLKVHLGLLFTIGLFTSGRIAVAFIWLMELLTPKH